jgi:hypothetical protein
VLFDNTRSSFIFPVVLTECYTANTHTKNREESAAIYNTFYFFGVSSGFTLTTWPIITQGRLAQEIIDVFDSVLMSKNKRKSFFSFFLKPFLLFSKVKGN